MPTKTTLTQRRKGAKVLGDRLFAPLRLCVIPYPERRIGFFLAITWLAAALALVAHAEPPANDASDVQDVLLLGPLEPIRLRLRIEIDGIPFRTAWREAFDRLFDQFDADHDGRLTPEQAVQVAALFGRGAAPGGAANAAVPASMMRAGGLTRDEVRGLVEQSAPPVSLRQRLSSRGAGPALVPLLDTDGDGRLSREELLVAEASLHCRDFNDDQLITEQELLAGPQMTASNPAGDSGVAEGSVILLTSSLDAAAVAEILLARYDRNRDGELAFRAPAEVLAAEGGLAALDADGNGILSRAELRGFLDLAPDADLPFVLGGASPSRKRGDAAPRFRLRRTIIGGFRLHVGSSEVDFRRNNRDPAQDDNRPRLRDYDANTDGFLDADEFMNVPNRPDFAIVDADGDKKISETEFERFFQQRARAGAMQLVLEATDQGSDLFRTLDRNFDRVLTPRELHTASDLLATEDRDGDGYLGGAEMSYNLTLELSRGGSRAVDNALVGPRNSPVPQVKADRKGPAWFLKMDRNRDGDVSLLEFLGPRETFARLDADGDGLLSADEVAKLEPATK
jgi:Ca2+-binding EF-hand superfamily protein